MNIIFQIDGGLGKSIMATAVVKAIKSHYKIANLIVVTAYTDVFLNNPNIHEIHRSDQINGLYLKYIKDKECKVLIADPYRDSDFIIESPISEFSPVNGTSKPILIFSFALTFPILIEKVNVKNNIILIIFFILMLLL